MFKEILVFELNYRFRRLSTYLYFIIFFLIAALSIIGSSGALKGIKVTVGDASGKVFLNAPSTIFILVTLLCYMGLFVITALMGNAVCRDFEHDSYTLFFTKPISKIAYLGGRFVGSIITLTFINMGTALGILVAVLLPIYDQGLVGPFRLIAFIEPYLVIVIPNLSLMGSIFFALTILFRSRRPVYIAAVILFVGYMAGVNLTTDVEKIKIAQLIDPLGLLAFIYDVVEYWTIAEKNSLLIPIKGMLLLNRAIWMSFSVVVMLFGLNKFRFSQFISEKKGASRIRTKETDAEPISKQASLRVVGDFSTFALIRQCCQSTVFEFKGIIKTVPFLAILLAGALFIFSSAPFTNAMYGTTVHPVTYQMLQAVKGDFFLFILIIITFYSGELVWRERDKKMHQLYDTLPIPNWVVFLSKLGALMLVQVVLLMVVMACGILIQTIKGYYNYEIGLYLKDLFGFTLISYLLICVLAMFVQVLVNNKYAGHFVMVGYYLVYAFMRQFGLEHNLYRYASDPGYKYSDMNGYGHYLMPYFYFKIYWGFLAILLAVIAYLFWVRSADISTRLRIHLAKERFSRPMKILAIAAFLAFIGTGSFIYYNTNILNHYRTTYETEELAARYEKLYKRYHNLAQPRITDVKVKVDIFPEQRAFRVKGSYMLKNKTTCPIDSLHLSMPDRDIIINKMQVNRSNRKEFEDKENGYYIYRLAEPLLPGDSMILEFDFNYLTQGFPNRDTNETIVHNGTFFNNTEYFPHIGYDSGIELNVDKMRKAHGLKPKERMAPVDDLQARMNNYIINDADWINFDAVVSTSKEQIALAPGYLQKEWYENDRHYFHYKMDSPIWNFWAFISARYEVKSDTWNNVAIDIYYHKGHEYNVDRMITALKKSFDYFTVNFGPYQHKQVRIIEFPRYRTFAQSFPNTIPYSESIGFIAKIDPASKEIVDFPFYITSHELAHQWWGHQVVGGNVQGATLMSEALSQYSAIMVMKKELGPGQIKKFLRYQLDQYLRGRSDERNKEMPLLLVEDQPYIHYGKGSIVMNALQDYSGEQQLNQALARYIKAVAYQQPPYTNSREFIGYIRQATPEAMQYIIHDMFETITLYDNKVTKFESNKMSDSKYKVVMEIAAKKMRSSELGAETEIPINDWIEIGVFSKDDKELYLTKQKIDKPVMQFTMVVDQRPEKAAIDPYFKLIDRKPDDNYK